MKRILTLGLLTLLAGCMVGPDYQRPPAPVPADYKEDGWKPAEPKDATRRDDWWSIYNDPVLDGLEKQIDISNQTLKSAQAAYEQARAVIAEAQSGLFPTVSVTGSGTRSGYGSNFGPGSGLSSSSSSISGSSIGLSAVLSWNLDIWGQTRRTIEADVANAQANAADVADARLVAQGQLATLYFELRTADALQKLLYQAVDDFTKSLDITKNQLAAGTAAQTDVVTAETQVEQTRAQAIAEGVTRAQDEHAIAALIGKPPSELSIAVAPLTTVVPVAPEEVPSALLERRPDIAASERLMAAANAQIGVAIAGYYPDITLSASYGYASTGFAKLLRAANSLWSVGGSFAEPVFNAGLTAAQVAAAKASYAETVANYRETVITGFQQVEDELAALRILAQQQVVEDHTVELAREEERLTLNQYLQGTVAYTSVIVAETTRLTNEETAVGIVQSRLVASAALIQALGGGWNARDLPNDKQVTSNDPAEVKK
jgi:NodT family efflux transporter outer membrane factor (OMF) lipoprotein